jgi:hypothetical protein
VTRLIDEKPLLFLHQKRLNQTFEMAPPNGLLLGPESGPWLSSETHAISGLRFRHLPDGSVVPRKHYQHLAAQYPDVDGGDKTVNTDEIGNQKTKPSPAMLSTGNGSALRSVHEHSDVQSIERITI